MGGKMVSMTLQNVVLLNAAIVATFVHATL